MMGFNCFKVAKPVEHHLLNVLFCHFSIDYMYSRFYSCCFFRMWYLVCWNYQCRLHAISIFMSFHEFQMSQKGYEKVTISKRLQCEDVRSNIAVTRRDRLNQILNEPNSN